METEATIEATMEATVEATAEVAVAVSMIVPTESPAKRKAAGSMLGKKQLGAGRPRMSNVDKIRNNELRIASLKSQLEKVEDFDAAKTIRNKIFVYEGRIR